MSDAAADPERAGFPHHPRVETRPRRPSRALESALRSGPFDRALRLAIQDSGLSLDSLRRRLEMQGIHVAVSTLSYWQRGVRRPERAESLRAVHALEELLGLRRSSIVALLGPPRPRGRWHTGGGGHLGLDATIGYSSGLSAVLEGLDPSVNTLYRQISLQGERWFGPDRTWSVERVRRIVGASEDGLDRFVSIYIPDAPGERPPEIRALQGCRLGRVREDPATGFGAAELLFDTPLRAGQLHVFDFEYLGGGDTSGGTEYFHSSRQPLRELVLRAYFDRGATPVRCYRVRKRRHDEEYQQLAVLQPSADGAVHVVALDCPSGIEGLSWEWD